MTTVRKVVVTALAGIAGAAVGAIAGMGMTPTRIANVSSGGPPGANPTPRPLEILPFDGSLTVTTAAVAAFLAVGAASYLSSRYGTSGATLTATRAAAVSLVVIGLAAGLLVGLLAAMMLFRAIW